MKNTGKLDAVKNNFKRGGKAKKGDKLSQAKNAFIGNMMKSKKAPCP